DVALTVLAHGCYRWLATRLRGFEKAKPKQLYRRFVETGGMVTVETNRVVVRFDKRSHNPILGEAALDRDCPGIPWLRNRPIVFEYPYLPSVLSYLRVTWTLRKSAFNQER